MVHKGKRATITQKGLKLIIKRSIDHPRIPRTKLAEQLQDELEAMGQDIPEVEVLERKISYWRNHAPDDPQDKPWSITSMAKYEIPAEALPTILEVYLVPLKFKVSPLTIRHAKWVARLFHTIKDPLSLWVLARIYSQEERVSEIMGGEELGIQEDILRTMKLYANMTEKSIKLKLPDEENPIDLQGQKQLGAYVERIMADLLSRPDKKMDWPYIIDIEEAPNEGTHTSKR